MAKSNKGLEGKLIADDLHKLADLLFSNQICNDVSPISTAAGICEKKATEISWEYDMGLLDFDIDAVGSMIPYDADELIARFSTKVHGNYQEDELNIKNPINSLNFNIELQGSLLLVDSSNDTEIASLYSSWHLDKNIYKKGDKENKYSHPEFHLTFGGDKMCNATDDKGRGLAYGSSLILPCPRIAYPPMDAVLGIDFIIKNYMNRDRRRGLVEDPLYQIIVENSQHRLWKCYYMSIASRWYKVDDLNIKDDFIPNKLLPFFDRN